VAIHTDCLKTIFKNVSGTTKHFSFLPPHGATLAPGGEHEVYGSFAAIIGKASNRQRKLDGLLRAMENGELAIKQSDSPILKDIVDSSIKVPTLTNTILGVGDACIDGDALELVFHINPQQRQTFQPFGGFGAGTGPNGLVGDGESIERAYDVAEYAQFGTANPDLARQFVAGFKGPIYLDSALAGFPAIRNEGFADGMFVVSRSYIDIDTPGLGRGTQHPLPNALDWTVHCVLSDFTLAGGPTDLSTLVTFGTSDGVTAGTDIPHWGAFYDFTGTFGIQITENYGLALVTTDTFASISPVGPASAFLLTLEYRSDPVVPFGPASQLTGWINGSDGIKVVSESENNLSREPIFHHSGVSTGDLSILFGETMSRLQMYDKAFASALALKASAQALADQFGFTLGSFAPV
jgi:hypothetical protein